MEPCITLLDSVWTDIADLCDGLSDEQWDQATDCPGWTVKDNVAHMIGTERMLAGDQAPPANVDGRDYIRNDIGKANEQWIETYRALTGKEVLDEFRKVTGARLETLRALTPDDWDREGFTPEGPGPYRTFMEIRVFDCWYHDQDIREALAKPGLVEGDVADMSLGRIGAKGLGYVVGKKAGAPPDSTVVFDIAGSPPFTVAIEVPPEGRARVMASAPASPTARVELDRRTYARLAGGRWSGDEARANGSVQVSGDTDLANRVVDNMSFTI
jgi:uncharacterized protein (TIGR03083 family)